MTGPVTDSSRRIERTIIVTVEAGDAVLVDIVTDRLWQLGVHAVSETTLGDGRVEVATSVGNDPSAIERATASLDPSWNVTVRDLDAAVVTPRPEFLHPTWYAPGHVSVPAALLGTGRDAEWSPSATDVEPHVTVIDQGSAFGLGDHPTTRTSMALLAELLDRRPPHDLRLLDVGCGTGALAVLAAQKGVGTIRAIDIADAAVTATTLNAELNDVSGRIDVDTTPVRDVDGRWDVIMANILAPVLISMADDLRRLLAPGGALIVSGILADRHDHVLDALAPLTPVRSLPHEGWVSIELTGA